MAGITKNKKIIIYSIIVLIFLGKIASLNVDKIDDFFCRTRYEMSIKKYNKLSSYNQFLEEKEKIHGIYFGSIECPYCVKNIETINFILDKDKDIYHYMIDFDNYENQKDLEKLKKRFKFDTIPHIVLFTENGEKQYSSRDIAKYSE